MKTRGLLSLPVMLIAVLALALGSVGTATASGLTKGAVKRIATKVLKKQAPALSVAHATTADTASNLGGKPATAFLNQTTTVLLAPVTGVASFLQTLPAIPNGTYLVTMNISASFSADGPLSCLLETNTSTDLMQNYSGTFNNFAKMNAAQVVTVNSPLKVFCTTNGATMTSPDGTPANNLSFTRIDSLTNAGTASRDGASYAARPDGTD
jgi:hypothetical protein